MEDFNSDIRQAIGVMRRGGVILYPTDTIWGLGCDSANTQAIERIFKIKQRDDAKAMIALVGSDAQLERTVESVPDVAWQLIEVADRPTTVVYDKGINVSEKMLGPDGSLGVRLTREEFSSALCRAFGRAIVSTSANISGHPAPRAFADIPQEIIDAVDYVCLSRRDDPCDGSPSMVIKISEGGLFKILRK